VTRALVDSGALLGPILRKLDELAADTTAPLTGREECAAYRQGRGAAVLALRGAVLEGMRSAGPVALTLTEGSPTGRVARPEADARPCTNAGCGTTGRRCWAANAMGGNATPVPPSAKCDTRIAVSNPPAPGSYFDLLGFGRPAFGVPPEWEAARKSWREWVGNLVESGCTSSARPNPSHSERHAGGLPRGVWPELDAYADHDPRPPEVREAMRTAELEALRAKVEELENQILEMGERD
jgi:hypothetical protein